MNDYLLASFNDYGLPILFFTILIAAIGVPLPASLLLIASGALVAQGDLQLWQVALVAGVAAMAGDQIGYGLGHWGGKRLIKRFAKKVDREDKAKEARAFAHRWGGASVFLSRWLVAPLGPWINLTTGAIAYPWKSFLLWDALGEVCWVLLYLLLGYFFSDHIQYLSGVMNNVTWIVLGGIVMLAVGWKVVARD